MRRLAGILVCILLACGVCMAEEDCPRDQPKNMNPPTRITEDFGENKPKAYVCLYGSLPPAVQTPSFWQLLLQTLGWQTPKTRPFGRSIAFLTGVSRYNDRAFDQLGFVSNDLTKFRNFLLTEGGFDAVYEARDENVTEELINRYMRSYFAKGDENRLGKDDRLLFYFSGHGGQQSGVPYLIFGAAKTGDFTQGVLPANQVREWARIILAKHLLIILDSCFSGLVPYIETKGLPSNEESKLNAAKLTAALSGEGSGLLLMAGTGDENAYADQMTTKQKGSVFTNALIGAWQSEPQDDGFITIEEAFGRVKQSVAQFEASSNKRMHPSWMPLLRSGDRQAGDFLFINSTATKGLKPPQTLYSGPLIPKDVESNQPDPNPIEISAEAGSLVAGRLTIAAAQDFISRAAYESQGILSCLASNSFSSSCSDEVAKIGRIVIDLKHYDASYLPLESWVKDVGSKELFAYKDKTNGYALLVSFVQRLQEFTDSKNLNKDERESQAVPTKCELREVYKETSNLSTFLATCDSDQYICNDEPRLKMAKDIRDRLANLQPEGLDLDPLKKAILQMMQKNVITTDQKNAIAETLDQLATELNGRSQGISEAVCGSQPN